MVMSKKASNPPPPAIIPWHTNPASLVGRMVYIETKDGSKRTGKITGEGSVFVELVDDRDLGNQRRQQLTFPLDLELNGDHADRVEWLRIKTILIR